MSRPASLVPERPLITAIRTNDLSGVERILAAAKTRDPNFDSNSILSADNKTPLFLAAELGNAAMVELIFPTAKNPNQTCKTEVRERREFHTPICIAATLGHEASVMFLMNKPGVIFDHYEQGPTAIAARRINTDQVVYHNVLLAAFASGNPKLVEAVASKVHPGTMALRVIGDELDRYESHGRQLFKATSTVGHVVATTHINKLCISDTDPKYKNVVRAMIRGSKGRGLDVLGLHNLSSLGDVGSLPILGEVCLTSLQLSVAAGNSAFLLSALEELADLQITGAVQEGEKNLFIEKLLLMPRFFGEVETLAPLDIAEIKCSLAHLMAICCPLKEADRERAEKMVKAVMPLCYQKILAGKEWVGNELDLLQGQWRIVQHGSPLDRCVARKSGQPANDIFVRELLSLSEANEIPVNSILASAVLEKAKRQNNPEVVMMLLRSKTVEISSEKRGEYNEWLMGSLPGTIATLSQYNSDSTRLHRRYIQLRLPDIRQPGEDLNVNARRVLIMFGLAAQEPSFINEAALQASAKNILKSFQNIATEGDFKVAQAMMSDTNGPQAKSALLAILTDEAVRRDESGRNVLHTLLAREAIVHDLKGDERTVPRLMEVRDMVFKERREILDRILDFIPAERFCELLRDANSRGRTPLDLILDQSLPGEGKSGRDNSFANYFGDRLVAKGLATKAVDGKLELVTQAAVPAPSVALASVANRIPSPPRGL